MSTPSTNTFEIGAGGGTRYFDGVLDDVRIYSRALCATEVAAIYAAAPTPEIVSWQEVDPYP